MGRKITYAEVGVDRELRAKSRRELQLLKSTYQFSEFGKMAQLPFGSILPFGKDQCLDFQIETVGTKVLIAQLAEKYDTIGIDGVAMAVNDVIRSGAKPFALVDNIHARSSDPNLIKELLRGIVKGAEESECVVPSGEIGDVAELIKGVVEGKAFDLVIAAIGEVDRRRIVTGRNLKAGDTIIGLRSSGIHSNGITLARRILFKHWGGKYEPQDIPEGMQKEIVYEALEPTRIYVKPFMKVMENCAVKADVHITGDAYLKFGRLTKFSKHIGFKFDNFYPQPIFDLIQKTAADLGRTITDEEMFKTFNMGWGFAIVVDKETTDDALDSLEKSGMNAEKIGCVTEIEGIEIRSKRRKIILE